MRKTRTTNNKRTALKYLQAFNEIEKLIEEQNIDIPNWNILVGYEEMALSYIESDDMLYDTSKNNRQKWINQIKEYTGETDDSNVIQFCLSYTLQSLKHDKEEVMTKFKWKKC